MVELNLVVVAYVSLCLCFSELDQVLCRNMLILIYSGLGNDATIPIQDLMKKIGCHSNLLYFLVSIINRVNENEYVSLNLYILSVFSKDSRSGLTYNRLRCHCKIAYI